MSYSYRLSRFAVFGWIAVVCAWGSAGAALASDNARELDPPNERMTIYDPPKAGHRTEPADNSRQGSFNTAFPVRIITDPADAEATNTREKERDEREKANLEATRKSASEAERAANIADRAEFTAKIATGGSVVGIFLLIWTLYETRKTANAGRVAARYAEENLRQYIAAERPFLMPTGGELFKKTEGQWAYLIKMGVINHGKGLSILREVRVVACIGQKILADNHENPDNPPTICLPVSPGGERVFDAPYATVSIDDDLAFRLGIIDIDYVKEHLGGEDRFYRLGRLSLPLTVHGYIRYSSISEKIWKTHFSFEFIPQNTLGGVLAWKSVGFRDEEEKTNEGG
jgi:hypothetical protein